MKTCYLIFCLLLASFIGVGDCCGQVHSNRTDSITITGIVVDELNDPMINASVALRNNDELICNTTTDYMGEFSFRISIIGITNLNMLIKYVGYRDHRIINIKPLTDTISEIKVRLQPSDNFLKDVTLPICTPLIIDRFSSGHTKTIKSDEIEKGAY